MFTEYCEEKATGRTMIRSELGLLMIMKVWSRENRNVYSGVCFNFQSIKEDYNVRYVLLNVMKRGQRMDHDTK